MKYKVVLEKFDHGFTVSVPAFPGCHSKGDTEEEALENIAYVIHEYLEVVTALYQDKVIREIEVEM